MGAVVALVLGSGTAYAATGGKFLIGKSNSATSTSVLTNTRGTALVLKSKAGTPPLGVNSATRVPNLNADRVDGIDGSAIALVGGQTNSVSATGFALDVNEDGINDLLVSFAECPTGTRLTGGGGADYTSGTMFVSTPLDKTSWWVVSSADVSTADPNDLEAHATCYNPRGSVPGGEYRVGAAHTGPSEADLDLMRTKLAKKVD